ncbi:MAG: hypothetical protein CMG04_06920 [Candidatus Marinimicrobia bacterium]|nr:hypothetical protein [Candidatus Neomarinimicrobiota bacterium]
MNKKRIIVVCPGRGSYTKETIGYIKNETNLIKKQINFIDQKRRELKEPTATKLDRTPFDKKLHLKGENASILIYSCSLKDFLSIDNTNFEIVAILGNSMGWYSALSFSGALNQSNSFKVVQTMGSMMKKKIIGGQIIYPIINDSWVINENKNEQIMELIKKVGAFVSINYGGYLIIGGTQDALDNLIKTLPPVKQYPYQLPYHGAFHTPLLKKNSEKAKKLLPEEIIQKPIIPLIDGNGKIWLPWSTDKKELWKYTFEEQVLRTYNFSTSIEVAIKEFCPDHLVLLGPGNALGGAVGQILIKQQWNGIDSKDTFLKKQNELSYLISMSLDSQRRLITI